MMINGDPSPDLFDIPLAQKILLLLRYLAAESDAPNGGDEMLFEILHFDFLSIAPIEITRLSLEVADRQFSDKKTSIRRLLYEKATRPPQDLFDAGLPEGLKRASLALEKLIGDVPDTPLPALFENCIRETGLLSFIIQNPDKIRLMRALTALSDLVREESLHNPDLNLEQLIQLANRMKANGLTMPPVPDTSYTRAVPARMAPEIQAAEEDLIGRRLEKFVMNVSALNNYLKCPLEFYYRNLVRVPSPRNEAMEFGSAVHHALQRLFERMKANTGEEFPSKEEMLSDFMWHMGGHREAFTREGHARRVEYGLEVLSNYYDQYLYQWNKIVAVERNIRNVIVRGVPLKGKLDKLEFRGKEVRVVDYKTGDVDRAREKLSPPNAAAPNGGDYWRQAVFYRILVDGYEQKDWTVTSTEFDFVEPDKKKEYRKVEIVIGPEDITTVTRQIITAWQKIQKREFYMGCGKPGCHWCNFVKTNNLAIRLHEINDGEI